MENFPSVGYAICCHGVLYLDGSLLSFAVTVKESGMCVPVTYDKAFSVRSNAFCELLCSI